MELGQLVVRLSVLCGLADKHAAINLNTPIQRACVDWRWRRLLGSLIASMEEVGLRSYLIISSGQLIVVSMSCRHVVHFIES